MAKVIEFKEKGLDIIGKERAAKAQELSFVAADILGRDGWVFGRMHLGWTMDAGFSILARADRDNEHVVFLFTPERFGTDAEFTEGFDREPLTGADTYDEAEVLYDVLVEQLRCYSRHTADSGEADKEVAGIVADAAPAYEAAGGGFKVYGGK